MLKEFSGSPRWWDFIWGSGWTPETDPTRQGWRCRPQRGDASVVIVGQAGVPGCASAARGATLDVAVYDESPEEVSAALATGRFLDPVYVQIPECSGWGITVLELIHRRRQELSADQL